MQFAISGCGAVNLGFEQGAEHGVGRLLRRGILEGVVLLLWVCQGPLCGVVFCVVGCMCVACSATARRGRQHCWCSSELFARLSLRLRLSSRAEPAPDLIRGPGIHATP